MTIQNCNRVSFSSNVSSTVADRAALATRLALEAVSPKSIPAEHSAMLGLSAKPQGACDMVNPSREALPTRGKHKSSQRLPGWKA